MVIKKDKPHGRVTKRTCPFCKDVFQVRISEVKRGKGIYCSRSCRAVMQNRSTGKRGPYKPRVNDFIDSDFIVNPTFEDK